MADVNHVITLGIGTPADIKHFVLVGLTPFLGPMAVTHWQLNSGGVIATVALNSGGIIATVAVNSGGVLDTVALNSGGVLDTVTLNTGGIAVGS